MTQNGVVHAAVHFVGCYALALTFMVFGVGLWLAFGLAAILGLAWETLDSVNKWRNWNFWLLDPKGGDFVDFLFDVFGCLLAVGVWTLVHG